MKKVVPILFTAALLAVFPLTAAAQSKHGGHAGHGGKDAAHTEMLVLGLQTVAGVKAESHLEDVRAAMARMKMKETHHLMVLFVDEATGKPIEEGTAAVKITDPAGKESDAIRLIAMDGHFGADLALAQRGKYLFRVGTRLPDGQTRQFEFSHTLK